MQISSSSALPSNRDVTSQSEYERAYRLAGGIEAISSKQSFSEKKNKNHSKKKSKDILLDGKPHVNLSATIESAVENDQFV